MSDALIIGLLAVVGTLIAVMTPIIKLNSNITTLNCNIKSLAETLTRDEDELKYVKDTVAQHQIDIGNAKKDIKILYHKTDELNSRKE